MDSLLKDFPIGSLLISETSDAYLNFSARKKARKKQGGVHKRIDLLDGQKRSLSLQAAFGGEGLLEVRSGRTQFLWLNLFEKNPRHDPLDPTHPEKGLQFHVRWFLGGENPNTFSAAEKKEHKFRRHLREKEGTKAPPKGWVKLSEGVRGRPIYSGKEEGSSRPSAEQEKTRVEILKRLSRAYEDPRVPVHTLPSGQNTSEELFQIFIRLNSAGTPLGAAEQFFAGVKQEWPEAEERLEPLFEVAGPLKRKDLITRVARAASKAPLKQLGLAQLGDVKKVGDPISIHLEKLSKAPKVDDQATGLTRNLLTWKMDKLTNEESPLPLYRAMKWVRDAFFDRIQLGILGISSVSWSAAVAWTLGYCATTGKIPPLEPKWIDPLLRFAFWTSAVGSRSLGRSKFDRQTFNTGWEEGIHERPFPFLRETNDLKDRRRCQKMARLAFNYTRIKDERIPQNPEDESRIEGLMAGNKWLFLGAYQEIGKNWTQKERSNPRIEWDHIFPRVRAD